MGIPTLFLDVDTLTETFPLRMDLKELVPSLDTNKRYNCTYTPGYIDELGELGFLQNLQHKAPEIHHMRNAVHARTTTVYKYCDSEYRRSIKAVPSQNVK